MVHVKSNNGFRYNSPTTKAMKQEHHGDILGYNLVYPDNGTMGKDCYVKLINGDVI
jgi:hypothetical protein